ncbi:hypothetical protein OH540_09505 [Streptomyces sp. BPPL-273]|uniref:hypothetical protein n=1 Tax=Streptomyces sp. BPPL-273 TaxID=2987533 RepID=UPI0024AF80E9|nr:hypothetical protein [Streptomyces sp. BPPL-273]WHM30258.1 hypothetical protein OH540_09505 [Streptomyces sp. BPPL-273]
MTGRALPPVLPSARVWQILRRCYPGQPPAAVLERALIMLAIADGHLTPSGQLKAGVGGRTPGRRQA